MMKNKKSKRGGARPGAGRKVGYRKPDSERKLPWSTTLHPEVIQWLRDQPGPINKILEDFVRSKIAEELSRKKGGN